MGFFEMKIRSNINFREAVKDKFKYNIKNNYLPDQTYINRLIASLDKVEANSYNQSHIGFISEYKYCEKIDTLLSIKSFVNGCLNQLLWINTILESDTFVTNKEGLNERFDYETPITPGNPWTLDKVTKKGVYFRGDEMYKDSRVIINSENIIEIALALSKVEHIYDEKSKPVKSVIVSSSKAKESSLFKSLELQNKCLNVLKEIKYPLLDVNGRFLNDGLKGAIVIWYDKCKRLGFISNEIKKTREVIAKEVMNIIPNLSIDGSNFSKYPAAIKYKEEIEQKLSQLSQKQ
ncbi:MULTISPECIES: hypothetical protein [Flavobacteriaceae]|uniref:Uncharacterized protein n=2 Tax=Flavobacteriaceae TaxID=49546 RepID=A0A4Y8ARK7_9FLAO|nr:MULTISPECIES: hypothetical protein [Flavobacteriaceae]TEW73821.1 hypothetical protein E2488_10090 [Gramella jeungdoensis]GGK37883.1 hypothetical protein GCM10007963_02480 [Lutibacter litoralis]